MTYTPIVIGSLAWGTPVNNAFTDHDARLSDIEATGAAAGSSVNGFLAMPYALTSVTTNTSLSSGLVFHIRVDLVSDITVSTITIAVLGAGAGLTAGQNFAGIYNAAGTRVGVTADQSASWASTGEKNMALTAPMLLTAGPYYVALLCNGATPISVAGGLSMGGVTALYNHGLTPATYRWSTGPAAQTTLPASVVMASRSSLSRTYWVGLS